MADNDPDALTCLLEPGHCCTLRQGQDNHRCRSLPSAAALQDVRVYKAHSGPAQDHPAEVSSTQDFVGNATDETEESCMPTPITGLCP